MSKNIILYDFFAAQGGAEYFATKFAEVFDAEIATGYIDENQCDVSTISSFTVTDLKAYFKSHLIRFFNLNYQFNRYGKTLNRFSHVIISGTHAISSAPNINKGKVIYYCHTIPRFAYDLYDYYIEKYSPVLRVFYALFCKYVRWEFERSIKHVDVFLCNSENVRKRIKSYVGYDAKVVYPPVETDRFQDLGQGDYYLSTARLEDHKRVDLIVKAFIKMPNKKLVVASGGSMLNELRELAKNSPNISFTGWTTKEQLIELMGRCIASIYIPIDEDFGISPVESMAAGKPVIGVDEGGLRETIVHLKTGVLCSKEISPNDLVEATNILNKKRCKEMAENCINQSEKFSTENFFNNMNKIINQSNRS